MTTTAPTPRANPTETPHPTPSPARKEAAHARPKRRTRREAPKHAAALTRELEDPAAPLRAIVQAVTRRVHERPLTAVAAMVALGVVVGGGLSFRLGRVLLAAASRHVVREVLKQVL